MKEFPVSTRYTAVELKQLDRTAKAVGLSRSELIHARSLGKVVTTHALADWADAGLAKNAVRKGHRAYCEQAQLALAVRLFQQSKVSLGQAATIAAQSKRAFIATLGREGVPVVNYPADELRGEVACKQARPPNQATATS